ncbi:hypothetical protein AB0C84_26895 [Actinomadura sp. NPDC048955]|uniref:hypothetical protein n=1 Tax=Actinomadura sp. NPDC048955 TaxID=3158228 RepID=UPI0033F767E5
MTRYVVLNMKAANASPGLESGGGIAGVRCDSRRLQALLCGPKGRVVHLVSRMLSTRPLLLAT